MREDDDSALLWEVHPHVGLVLVDEAKHEEYLYGVQALRSARTFGDLAGKNLPSWAESIVEGEIDSLEDEGVPFSPSLPWSFSFSDRDAEAYPCPWNWAEIEWACEDRFSELLLRYGNVSGGPGSIDVYTVNDPDALIDDLTKAGLRLVHSPGLVNAYLL